MRCCLAPPHLVRDSALVPHTYLLRIGGVDSNRVSQIVVGCTESHCERESLDDLASVRSAVVHTDDALLRSLQAHAHRQAGRQASRQAGRQACS